MTKLCVIEDRSCTNCNECLLCDLDKTKQCDNCCKCLGEADYSGVEIDDILLNLDTPVRKKPSKRG